MLTNRIFLKRHLSYLKYSYVSARYFAQTTEEPDELTINLDVKLAPLPEKKPQREPFIKNVFLGKFDTEILTYPEVQTNERQNQFQNWLIPIEECVDHHFATKKMNKNEISNEVLEQLKDLGVFRATLSEEFKGLGLSETEYAKLIEVVGKNPSLASHLLNHTLVIQILLKYGNDDQKKKYLPRIANGELFPTFCLHENSKDIGLSPVASATLTECGKFWKLNAEKVYVPNGNQANLFIVFANLAETNDPLHKPANPSMFIIERESGEISSNTVEKIGQEGLEVCTVTFKDTLAPKENLINEVGSGPKIMIDLLSLGKQSVGSQAAAILKKFINAVSDYVIEQKYFEKQLMEYQFTQELIAKMTSTLYAIESMTYLTTGLTDQYENQDCTVENAIVEAYSAKECVKQIYEGLQLMGKQTYLKDSPYEKLYRDALGLTLFNSSHIELCTFISLLSLHHVGSVTHEVVKKYRNPFMFPEFIFKKVLSGKQYPDLALEEYLHPSLQISARLLTECVHMLNGISEKLLVDHGSNISDAFMNLQRLAEMAMDIYAMTAVLGRASRAYCIGLRHSDEDLIIAYTICWNAHNRVKSNFEILDLGEIQNCNDLYKMISKKVFEQRKYFPEHPLTKNY